MSKKKPYDIDAARARARAEAHEAAEALNIQAEIDTWPAFTDEQRRELALILWGSDGS